MAQLIVRNVPESVVRALKVRAAAKGHSAEAEHRELLREALLSERRGSFKDYLLSMPKGATDAELLPKRSKARRVDL